METDILRRSGLKAKSIRSIFVFISLVMCSCSSQAKLSDKFNWNGGSVYAKITKAKQYEEEKTKKSLVYGTLKIKHPGEYEKKINLTCIAITVDDAKSEMIYVDSVASILPDGFTLKKKESIIPVYWKMNKDIGSSLQGKAFKVFIKPGCKFDTETNN